MQRTQQTHPQRFAPRVVLAHQHGQRDDASAAVAWARGLERGRRERAHTRTPALGGVGLTGARVSFKLLARGPPAAESAPRAGGTSDARRLQTSWPRASPTRRSLRATEFPCRRTRPQRTADSCPGPAREAKDAQSWPRLPDHPAVSFGDRRTSRLCASRHARGGSSRTRASRGGAQRPFRPRPLADRAPPAGSTLT